MRERFCEEECGNENFTESFSAPVMMVIQREITIWEEKKMSIKKFLAGMTMALVMTVMSPAVIPGNAVSTTVEAAQKTNIKLNKTRVTVKAGSKTKLKVSGTSKKVTWKSSNKTIATVTSKGVVTGKKAGTVKITAQVGSKKLVCKVTVQKVPAKKKEYFNDNVSEDYGLVSVKPYHVYYKGDKVYAECYVINGFNHPVWNILVNSLTLSDGKNVFANAAFGRMGNVSLGAHCYVKWTFVFEKNAVLHQNADLDYLRYSASTEYSY